MKAPIKDHQQSKVTGGEQKVILNPAETGETDELDPKFDDDNPNPDAVNPSKPEPGDDPKTELI